MLGFYFGGIFRGALSGFVQKNRKFLVLQVLRRPWLIFTNSIYRDRLRVGMRVVKSAAPNLRFFLIEAWIVRLVSSQLPSILKPRRGGSTVVDAVF